ncbi:1,2-dihydroxy-3-keto-5-methylthiopentene dioxygenase [Mycena sanguinolenta]|uniref:acireductone dioxygenase (Fe(2+)-requiring) n=1 Tax=Mycena sanguinolenta TaxID=230812 RepID=A0A8H6Y3E4_9AGAR|nr:1,2-dihydroxy-3-keto-5-methylthiopentene dioxygenase [Mycena sanguinolenta]
MHAYYFDNLPTDQRLLHTTYLLRPVSTETLAKLGGVDERDDEFEVNRVAKERGYKNRDVINLSREGTGSVYEKIRGFFEEHMHEDEEIRYILSGNTPTDPWIRIVVAPGDLLVLPAGIYHRFTLDTKDQIRALRLFKFLSLPLFVACICVPSFGSSVLRRDLCACPSSTIPFDVAALPSIHTVFTPSSLLPSFAFFLASFSFILQRQSRLFHSSPSPLPFTPRGPFKIILAHSPC